MTASRWLMLGAVIGPILFTLSWIVIGFFRPGYSSIAEPISALGLGIDGWYMDAAIIINAALCILGVFAIFVSLAPALGLFSSGACAALLVLPPLGALCAGIFNLASFSLHSVGAQLAYGAPTIAFPAVGFALRRLAKWQHLATWMMAGGLTTLIVLDVLILNASAISRDTTGLWQRILCTEILAWYVVVGWQAFRLQTQAS